MQSRAISICVHHGRLSSASGGGEGIEQCRWSARRYHLGNITDASDVAKAVLVSVDAAAARTAIGGGTSDLSGSYNDLSDKPAIPVEGDAAMLETGTDLIAHTWSAKLIHDEIARCESVKNVDFVNGHLASRSVVTTCFYSYEHLACVKAFR